MCKCIYIRDVVNKHYLFFILNFYFKCYYLRFKILYYSLIWWRNAILKQSIVLYEFSFLDVESDIREILSEFKDLSWLIRLIRIELNLFILKTFGFIKIIRDQINKNRSYANYLSNKYLSWDYRKKRLVIECKNVYFKVYYNFEHIYFILKLMLILKWFKFIWLCNISRNDKKMLHILKNLFVLNGRPLDIFFSIDKKMK